MKQVFSTAWHLTDLWPSQARNVTARSKIKTDWQWCSVPTWMDQKTEAPRHRQVPKKMLIKKCALPVTYTANKKAWMVSDEFISRVKQLDRQFASENRRVLLIIGHPAVEFVIFPTPLQSIFCCKISRQIFKAMDPVIRRTFGDVNALLQLLVISPASSTEAERSFSALRRLKTWLCSTMSQERLNHVMICHVHQEELSKNISIQDRAQEFIDNWRFQASCFWRILPSKWQGKCCINAIIYVAPSVCY